MFILLATDQLISSSTADCIWLTCRFPTTSDNVVSSTNLCVNKSGLRSSIRIRNTSGPNHDPCGTPPRSETQLEKYPSTAIRCCLSQRNEVIQSVMISDSPNVSKLVGWRGFHSRVAGGRYFLPCNAVHKRGLCRRAVYVCPSVRPSCSCLYFSPLAWVR